MNNLLVKKTRVNAGREESPSYSLIDSQSAKTTAASVERGYDGGKNVKGRKRHIVTDTMGNLLSVVVMQPTFMIPNQVYQYFKKP